MLIVMENRNIHDFFEPLLNYETFRGLDVFKVDATESWSEKADTVDEFIDVACINFDVNGVNIGKGFEKDTLAFHHRLGAHGPEITEAQYRCAIGNHRNHIAFVGVVVGDVFVLCDLQARCRDAW